MALIADAMLALESAGSGYVQTSYDMLSATILPIAKIFFTILIAWFGIQGMMGINQFSLGSIFRLSVVIALVILGLTTKDVFITYFYNIVIKAPEQIGTVLFDGFSASGTPAGASGAESGLQKAWDTGFETFQAIFAKAGLTNPGPAFLAIFVLIVVVLFVAIAFFIIAISKMFAFVLLALAPLFIVLAAFAWTRNWFISYINSLFHVSILLVVAYALIGFILGMSSGIVDTLNVSSSSVSQTMTEIGPFLFYMVIGILSFTRVPQLAAMLAGGIAMDTGQYGARGAFDNTIGRANRAISSNRQGKRNAQAAEQKTVRKEAHVSSVGKSIADAVQSSRTQ